MDEGGQDCRDTKLQSLRKIPILLKINKRLGTSILNITLNNIRDQNK